ncbi:MAG: DNA repair protein RadC [Oscillospiraceae bacterium]|jgi:DNA repair protein RadC|nr:DNA repair protein RadC [Ruminococcus sp.]MDD7337380.1 DNA repair protein RadC [Ruminococcus sp.]MDY6060538.1 DNA repair protein RadC [Oscillospiraceae bacterium]
MAESSIHDGHRKRVREAFLKRDLDSMPEHEILELLLFYSQPRGDTNKLAHELINTFGSLESVLSANYEDLMKVKGVGESTAALLVLFSRLSIKYVSLLGEEKDFADKSDIIDMLKMRYKGEKNEVVLAVFYDSRGKYINTVSVGGGSISEATFKPRELAQAALRCNASRVILAHNHPQGFAVPSLADVQATKAVRAILMPLDIEMTDHIIIAGEDSFSMCESKKYRDIFLF